ncbi:hypothetical protein BDQ12DRAFT_719200 [Crucibulum laeve]|uniref:Uncharacterized protein n=1 Tax=Crucibulum laeve TaxID=68775 RepID=A0A5C3MD45_9AGAR|nr:hypothetical protein BDQ12DRAFT_719200 [Crucibulum laeve]
MSLTSAPPSVLNVHTPTSSFAIVHSLTQESLLALCDKLSRKAHTDYHGERVGPGWLKYEYNDTIWNLDDDSDYTIFVWRQQQAADPAGDPLVASTSSAHTIPPPTQGPQTPTLHLHNPKKPLPEPPEYLNASYYLFHPSRAHYPAPGGSRPPSRASKRSAKSKKGKKNEEDGVPAFKKNFDKFHSENGVRTVMGSIGPVRDVRMLLKSGYRHVYISRKFAMKHGFIPADAAPGHYGYSGLVNIGTWPISLVPSSTSPGTIGNGQTHLHAHPTPSRSPSPSAHSQASHHKTPAYSSSRIGASTPSLLSVPTASGGTKQNKKRNEKIEIDPKAVMMQVYLSEEPHFDVVLGRSFFEKRQIKTSAIDPTDVVCLDTGEKIECELVILKDGRGEIVTVT